MAEELFASLNLQPITIGTAPYPEGTGLIGVPIWVWAQDPGPQTWGPLEQTITDGDVTVTMVAEVSQATWTMGDGNSVTCASPGTPWDITFGDETSPDCGYVYPAAGSYAVGATTEWNATWTSNTGEEGSLGEDLPATPVTIQIAEAHSSIVG